MIAGNALWVAYALAAAVSIWGITVVLRIDSARFSQAGYRRLSWVGLILLFGPLGVLFFFATVRHHVLHPERYRSIDGVAPADR